MLVILFILTLKNLNTIFGINFDKIKVITTNKTSWQILKDDKKFRRINQNKSQLAIYILNHPYRILIIGKTNRLSNLIKHQ